jgi:hypothetical protein
VGFNITIQLLVRFSAFVTYWRKNWSTKRQLINYSRLQESLSFRKEGSTVQLLIQTGVPMKLVRLIKMYLNETYSKENIGKHLSDNFPVQINLKQGDAHHYCFSTLL